MEKLTRRGFLRLSAMGAAGAAIVACQPQTVVVKETVEVEKVVKETVEVEKVVKETVQVEKQVTVAPAFSAQQAPMLKAMVETGELPDLAERMPVDPVVLEPLEMVGKYGGTHRVALGRLDLNNRRCCEGLLLYGRDSATLENNLVSKWEVTSDGTQFTFYLRKGIKWSSGDPFSADDIMYWYEDVLLNEEITPTPPSWFKPGAEVGKTEKLDDYTVAFSFDAPNATLPDQCPFGAYQMVYYPMEYMKQFHVNYADKDALDALVKERGFEQWFQLHQNRRNWDRNPDYPVHGAWKSTSEDWTTHHIADRNAYFCKVDTEGNQLPYLDRLVDAVTSVEMVPMKIVAGEVDQQDWNTAISNYTLYMENREQGDYQVRIWNYGSSGTALQLNQARLVEEGDAAGQELRELFQNRDFRVALSKALDRERINQLNYKGLADLPIELFPESVKNDPEIQALFEYDPDQANQILDDLGMSERDGEGMRLTPNGNPLNIMMTGHTSYAVHLDVGEVLSALLREVGIRATTDAIAGEMWTNRVRPGDVDAIIYETDYTSGNAHWLTYPRSYLCMDYSCYWAPRYGLYYQTDGNEGDEPPPEVRRLQDIYDECLVTIDLERRKVLEDEAFRACAYNLWPIPTLASRPEPCIVKNGFRNVPEYCIMAYPTRGQRTAFPELYFWEKL